MKTLRNFLVANVFALFPLLWIAFGWMPRQVKVEMRGNVTTPVAVATRNVVLQGQEHGRGKEGAVWKFYLRNGMQWNQLAFRLPEGMDERHVVRVWIEKWKLVALGKPGTGLQRKKGRTNDYVFANPRFEWVGVAQGAVPPLLAGVEVLILGVSWWCSKRHREERCKTLLPSVLGVAFALSLLMQVALPVQSCVSNQSAFPFTPWELCGFLAVRFMVSWAAGVACLFLLARTFGRWVLSAVFAFAVCAYLESGILSAGLPSLNGDWEFFADRGRGLKDAAAWGCVFAVVLGLHRWLNPWLGVAGSCLSILSCAAMLDAKPEEKADSSNLLVQDFSSIETVLRSVTYSTNRNTMVFIIDSLERHQAHAIMEDPQAGETLRRQFHGFTEYTNNIGACEFSLPAVANLMTGKYPGSAMDPDFYASVYSRESVLKDFLEAGYAVYMGTHALGYGYTNRKREWMSNHSDKRRPGSSGWGLVPFCRFRWIPFLAKAPYAWLESQGKPMRDGKHDVDKEPAVYGMLADAPVSPEERGSMLLVHTDGVHVPVSFNRYGEQLPRANNTEEGCIECGIFIMQQLGRLLDVYREKGIYDRSLIIVMADHGHHGGDWTSANGAEDGFPGNGCPFLWIKPPYSKHPFMASAAPTTHSKVFAMLRESLDKDLRDSDIQTVLSGETRLYRRGATPNWHDYHVDGNHRWRMEIVEQKSEVSAMRPLPLGKMHALKFNGREARVRGNIQFSGFLPPREGTPLGWLPVWAPPQREISLAFKVPSASHACRVQLIGHFERLPGNDGMSPPGCVRFSANGKDGAWVAVCDEGVVEVVLNSVVPNENGIIEITGIRDDGCSLTAILSQLRVVVQN